MPKLLQINYNVDEEPESAPNITTKSNIIFEQIKQVCRAGRISAFGHQQGSGRKSVVRVKHSYWSGRAPEALLRRTAVKYPRGAVRLARGLIRLSRTPPRAFSIHLNNGQAGNPLNRCALVP